MKRRARTYISALIAIALLQGCLGGKPLTATAGTQAVEHRRPQPFTLIVGPGITAGEKQFIEDRIARGMDIVEGFFNKPFTAKFKVHVFGTRKDLDAFWRVLWAQPNFKSRCWMVASGRQDSMAMLSPAAWPKEACDHDATNEQHVQNLITHELVHVYHDQHNPAVAFEGFEPLGWFVEGLAAYVSGQMEEQRRASPVEAVRLNKSPQKLADAWSGKYRYSVSGSLVKFLESRGGRALLWSLLKATSAETIYLETGLEEQPLLEKWRAWVLED